ncbi:MAG: UDP-N-acetylmuramoyl-tripeptide--D-alanyl-D-alanine ligase [Synechococcales cyanobacterium RU_4_20]|nr:UDP-N-acetylmuramoyl-tripeptide--D-alanyl-D-alanine ligase [Synechococcales cyanobacterium RU_4_20]
MNHSFTLSHLLGVLQATVLHPIAQDDGKRVRQVSTDSRGLAAGDVFVALRGDRFDGHAFVEAAWERGAIAAIVDRQFVPSATLLGQTELLLLQVPDTLVAYQQLGQAWRQQFAGPLVAITGSVGKTTTKELIAAVLATAVETGPDGVLKTEANYNNEIGVPKTLLQLHPGHRFAVVEMGMRGLGEIELLSRLATPDVAVITNVGTAHIERLGSEEAIAQAKCELLLHLKPEGTAVLNADNERLMQRAAQVWSGKTLTFGLDRGDVCGQLRDAQTLQVGEYQFQLPLPGRHNALNFLAALAVAQVLGIDGSGLGQLQLTLPSGRSQRYALPQDVVILDETYNAGLESMLAALELLADTPGQRRIAVLGTMKELGDRSLEFHQQVGERVAKLQLDALLTLAEPAEAAILAQGAAHVHTRAFGDGASLSQYLTTWVKPGDRLLFKASRAVALDRVVDQFRQDWPSERP